MNKFVIVSDSFKGTLSSKEIANIFENKVKLIFDEYELEKFILSDGGEGFLESIEENIEGERINLTVSGPYLEGIETYYFLSKDNVAYVEAAKVIGLNLVEKNPNPMKTTSYGIGEIIRDIVNRGIKKIYIGLGGTCTNDGGTGALAAIGSIFVNKNGRIFIPTGGTLNDIAFIDNGEVSKYFSDIEIVLLTDVKNKICGELGASYTFSKQKGADDEMAKELENNMIHYVEEIKRCLGIDITNINSLGAAGGIAAGFYAFLNAKIESGIESILKLSKFDERVKDADYVFTGEGSFDNQSLNGKAISGIAEHIKKFNIPLIVVSGSIKEENEKYVGTIYDCAFSTNRTSEGYDILKNKQKENYEYTIENILRLIKITQK